MVHHAHVATSRLLPGVDVPWVTCWSEEPLAGVLRCRELGGRLAVAQVERPGEGKPIYSKNHAPRQRLSALRGLCPMCGRPTRRGDRWSLTSRRASAGELRARGLGHLLPASFADDRPLMDAGSIAPLHKACATRSAVECPHLRSSPTTNLAAFPDRTLLVPLTVEAQPMRRGDAILNTPTPSVSVVGFVQIIGVPD